MNKTACVAILAALMCITGCSNHKTIIDGNITGLSDRRAYLAMHDTEKKDSTDVVSGKFQFEISSKRPDVVFIKFADEPNFRIPVMTDGNQIAIKGDFADPFSIVVSGSVANDSLQSYRRSVSKYDIMLRSIALDIASGDPLGPDSLQLRSLEYKRDSLIAIRTNIRNGFISSNPANPAAAFLVASNLSDSTTLSEVKAMISRLDTINGRNAFIERLRAKRKELSSR